MTVESSVHTHANAQPTFRQWLTLGLSAGIAAIVAVLIVQALALVIWPDTAQFQPLDSYVRSAIFTLIPALIATAVLAWLARRSANPVPTFLWIAGIVLLLSFIPDYILPVPGRTFTASTITAGLHVVAAAVIVPFLVRGYRRMTA